MGEVLKKYSEWQPTVNRILKDAKQLGIDFRLTGGIAIRFHCEKQNELFEKLGRKYADVDLVCLSKDIEKSREYFSNKGYELNKEVYAYSEGRRLIFKNQKSSSKLEAFVDELNFCHLIDLRERLSIDYPTISLSDLLLSKMQIVKISDKDLLDLSILILEHELSNSETKDSINVKYIAKLLSNDWGFYYTFSNNIKNIFGFISSKVFTDEQREKLNQKLNYLNMSIDREEKKIKWKIREVIGKRLKWYNEVSKI
ncbi:MAG: hypothetical protein NTZ69_18980 [Bacteroidia bacterium]|nr:hypothetical protein [Bacteroidia bacterium]